MTSRSRSASSASGQTRTPRGPRSNIDRSPDYGALQKVVDSLYHGKLPTDQVARLDVVLAADAADLPADLIEIVNLLPPGRFNRRKLCDQLNSAIGGHAWGQVYGTVE
jgi:hypothetical protein